LRESPIVSLLNWTGAKSRQPIKKIDRIKSPPIKCQGIKTKLTRFIAESVHWTGRGRWVEPFLGSGAVLFNIRPQRAMVSDSNVHIINVYNEIKNGKVTPQQLSNFLYSEGKILLQKGMEYFYHVRERFNNNPNSFDFIFLTRSCFNGVMRFNKKGYFNVPFCKKTDRFRQAYITKIVNQIAWVQSLIKKHDWEFITRDWKETLANVSRDDFVYADPPYSGRHTDYYNKWSDEENQELIDHLLNIHCGFALSTWYENKYRKNPIFDLISNYPLVVKKFDHFYHVGSSETYRNKMIEALVIDREHAR